MTIHKYLQIVSEAAQWERLSDAGPAYSPGETQIWFAKSGYRNDLAKGYNWISKNLASFHPKNIRRTHTFIGKIAETNPSKIFQLMQDVAWNPNGHGTSIIAKAGAGHTSMNVGDIIVVGGKKLMADKQGFIDLATGKAV